jgi:hypothetical protein
MNWGEIVPALLVGGFGGWVWGVVQGHGDTQAQMAKSERKMLALMAHLHRGQMAQIAMTDLMLGVAQHPDRAAWYWESWCLLRKELREGADNDTTGFFAEMYQP